MIFFREYLRIFHSAYTELCAQQCGNNYDQYKRIIEAIKDDGTNVKRVRMRADDGLLYNKTCLQKLC